MGKAWDLIVIGGGAAGFYAAITAAEARSGLRVLVLEKTGRVLGKVKVSGGGRCNVTHDCADPRAFSSHYPRGNKALIGPLNRWSSLDTIAWFEQHGVELKIEEDGRMFPTTNDSQTVIDCLTSAAATSGVEVRTSTAVTSIKAPTVMNRFLLETNSGKLLESKHVLLATGGTRLAAGAKLAESLGHTLIPDVPSLFAFNIKDERIDGLAGISVQHTDVSVEGMKLEASGPLLVTHQGLSGPGILKLSAWGARDLHGCDYHFSIRIDWLPGVDAQAGISRARKDWGKRLVTGRAPFEGIPKRLWQRLCDAAGVPKDCTWSQISKDSATRLLGELTDGRYHVSGKSMNKDEFVTCGGVPLKEVDMRTMESKIIPGLYFAGEVLDIDGITGGFNFQNAWTSGHLAGLSIAER